MWCTRVSRGVRSHSGVRNVMPFTTSSTTSASGTRPRHCRRIARGNTVERPPARYRVKAPIRSTGAAPGYEQAITETRWPHAIQRDTCPNRFVPVPPPWGCVQSRSDRIRMWSGRSVIGPRRLSGGSGSRVLRGARLGSIDAVVAAVLLLTAAVAIEEAVVRADRVVDEFRCVEKLDREVEIVGGAVTVELGVERVEQQVEDLGGAPRVRLVQQVCRCPARGVGRALGGGTLVLQRVHGIVRAFRRTRRRALGLLVVDVDGRPGGDRLAGADVDHRRVGGVGLLLSGDRAPLFAVVVPFRLCLRRQLSARVARCSSHGLPVIRAWLRQRGDVRNDQSGYQRYSSRKPRDLYVLGPHHARIDRLPSSLDRPSGGQRLAGRARGRRPRQRPSRRQRTSVRSTRKPSTEVSFLPASLGRAL